MGLKYGSGDRVEEVQFPTATSEVVELERQIASLVRSIREGTPVAATGADGRWSVLLCLAAQKSVACGRPIPVAEMQGDGVAGA